LSAHPSVASGDTTLDVAIVGAGYGGLLMLHRARELGLTARIFERSDSVGGTWHANRYPGARCDTESLEYSYQFSDALFQEWQWSERFATQPELLAYARHVAERFDLLRDIRFRTEVRRAVFDEAASRWHIDDATGSRHTATFLVLATGCLSSANVPQIPGLDAFGDALYHTGKWPTHPVSFAGKRVGIIGTGSSAVQAIPMIAKEAADLIVFQRTPNYVVPAHNGPICADYESRVRADPAQFRANNATMSRAHGWVNRGTGVSALSVPREEVERDLQRRWETGGLNFLDGYTDLLTEPRANDIAAEFVRHKIRSIVRDPQVAARLCPTYPIGCKRVSVGDGYYETFNRSNVHLVDVKQHPLARVVRGGIVAGEIHHALDALICATGFDAMTGPILAIDIVGVGGLSLREKWHAGPLNYLGLTVSGFPNLFTLTGPGSPSVLTNMHVSLDQHTAWVADCLRNMMASNRSRIEALESAESDWVRRVSAIASGTIFPTCNSWYLGANVPGKPRVFMPFLGYPSYVELSTKVAEEGYAGFQLA
jgi:cation diffusion facilitator CzcD-associated flavoprotein CzcO